jgi:hypothetical protein
MLAYGAEHFEQEGATIAHAMTITEVLNVPI